MLDGGESACLLVATGRHQRTHDPLDLLAQVADPVALEGGLGQADLLQPLGSLGKLLQYDRRRNDRSNQSRGGVIRVLLVRLPLAVSERRRVQLQDHQSQQTRDGLLPPDAKGDRLLDLRDPLLLTARDLLDAVRLLLGLGLRFGLAPLLQLLVLELDLGAEEQIGLGDPVRRSLLVEQLLLAIPDRDVVGHRIVQHLGQKDAFAKIELQRTHLLECGLDLFVLLQVCRRGPELQGSVLWVETRVELFPLSRAESHDHRADLVGISYEAPHTVAHLGREQRQHVLRDAKARIVPGRMARTQVEEGEHLLGIGRRCRGKGRAELSQRYGVQRLDYSGSNLLEEPVDLVQGGGPFRAERRLFSVGARLGFAAGALGESAQAREHVANLIWRKELIGVAEGRCERSLRISKRSKALDAFVDGPFEAGIRRIHRSVIHFAPASYRASRRRLESGRSSDYTTGHARRQDAVAGESWQDPAEYMTPPRANRGGIAQGGFRCRPAAGRARSRQAASG